MNGKSFAVLTLTGILVLLPLPSKGQSLWELGNVRIGRLCTKNGNALIGGLIGVEAWFLNSHCLTYGGSAGCVSGLCKCNQGSDAYYNATLGVCLGKVGAHCSAEHNNFFPDKLCTPNADCVPMRGEGDPVGKCQCLHGYKPNAEDYCIEDIDVEPIQRSTPRPTTTTEAQPAPPLRLPLDIMFDNNIQYDKQCGQVGILNYTTCNTHSFTVSCLGDPDNNKNDRKCRCNMRDDSIWDDKRNMCVGLAGTWCLGRQYSLGFKLCVENSDCELLDGHTVDDGYSFGFCKCVYGYNDAPDGSGTCVEDKSITNPSTPRPVVTRAPIPTITPGPGITKPSTDPSGGGGGGDNSGARGLYSSGYPLVTIILFFIYNRS